MATPAQILANRENATFSTGPRSETGKLASSQNAQSHGLTTSQALLPGEDPAEYQEHHQDYADRYRPQSTVDQDLVNELADLRWRLRRVPGFEVALLNAECTRLTTEPEFEPLLKNVTSATQILALAFTRLLSTRVLPNLFHQEARLARRAERLQAQLEATRPRNQTIRQPVIAPESDEPTQPSVNRKIEAKPQPVHVTPQPGRNELCPCNSGLKYKRCCLNKPSAARAAA